MTYSLFTYSIIQFSFQLIQLIALVHTIFFKANIIIILICFTFSKLQWNLIQILKISTNHTYIYCTNCASDLNTPTYRARSAPKCYVVKATYHIYVQKHIQATHTLILMVCHMGTRRLGKLDSNMFRGIVIKLQIIQQK